jgi:hypothetical protein
MAYYAFLDQDNIVTEVIPGKDEEINGVDWEKVYSEVRGQVCKRTSYNTQGGVHLLGGTPFRKNYAAIGSFYDQSRDAFIHPKPYPSWILNESTCQWEAPVSYPLDGKIYQWNETNQQWETGTKVEYL